MGKAGSASVRRGGGSFFAKKVEDLLKSRGLPQRWPHNEPKKVRREAVVPPPVDPHHRNKSDKPRFIKARFDGSCKKCGVGMPKGSSIAWFPVLRMATCGGCARGQKVERETDPGRKLVPVKDKESGRLRLAAVRTSKEERAALQRRNEARYLRERLALEKERVDRKTVADELREQARDRDKLSGRGLAVSSNPAKGAMVRDRLRKGRGVYTHKAAPRRSRFDDE